MKIRQYAPWTQRTIHTEGDPPAPRFPPYRPQQDPGGPPVEWMPPNRLPAASRHQRGIAR
jgi:hypothetical protein